MVQQAGAVVKSAAQMVAAAHARQIAVLQVRCPNQLVLWHEVTPMHCNHQLHVFCAGPMALPFDFAGAAQCMPARAANSAARAAITAAADI